MLKKTCVLLLAVIATGCGSGRSGPKPVDVSGTVAIDGKPMAGVEVHFVLGDHDGYGKTNDQGKFDLINGAVPGQNKVYFTKIQPGKIKADPDAGIDDTQLRIMAEASGKKGGSDLAKELIPADYASLEKTKLTYNVPESGATDASFKLSSK